jgi:hypothetical protein
MDKTTEEDWLDRQLREAAPYIDDDGFTRCVLGKLPAARRQRNSSRAVILIGLTMLGSLIAYFISDGGRFVTEELMRLATLPMWWIFLLAMASGALVTVVGCAAALSKSRELQS